VKFTEDQIAFALRQNELGTSVDEVQTSLVKVPLKAT
jgi:hypothetical protein